ncbi:MAG: MFS transporter [Verrucomicrobia bacterium]|nr:MFS transporter [Verrucomicrobiota bacterium]
MPEEPASPPSAKEAEYPRPGWAWYVVALLTLAYVFSFIDRQILNLLVGPIQRDLGIGEKEMSLLMGASFAVFYTLFGIPLGRLADTGSRRWLVVSGTALWSLMTAACGLTLRFWQLALARMGVGVGEASLSPAAYSLIADCFPPERRSTALGVYGMGIYIGQGMALILGGLVIQFTSAQETFVLPLTGAVRSWQVVFFAVGLPGLLVALLLLTIREPVRRGARVRSVDGGAAPAGRTSLREAWMYLTGNRGTFLCLFFGMGFAALNGYGSAAWIPTFFIRRHGWTAGDTGVIFGLIVGICGTAGIVTAGRVADWLRQRGRRDANLRLALWATVAWLPFGALFPLVPSGRWAAALLAPALFLMSMPFGLAPAAIQQLMPNPMRGQASALYLFVINLMGLGFGPTVVAFLTEDVFHDRNALHLSLTVLIVVGSLCSGLLLRRGLKHYGRTLDYLSAWSKAGE